MKQQILENVKITVNASDDCRRTTYQKQEIPTPENIYNVINNCGTIIVE